jgi:signal transduction histidine kinase
MRKKTTLLKIFLISFGIGAIIICASFLTFSVIKQHLKQNLLQTYSEQEQLVGNEVSSTLTTSVSGLEHSLEIMALNPAIESNSQSVCFPAIMKYYNSVQLGVDNLVRVNTNGQFFCSINTKLDGTPASNLGPYITDMINDPTHAPVMSNYIENVPGTPGNVIALHVPVYDSNGKFQGSLGGAIYLSRLASLYLNKIKFANTGYASLVDQNGDILYSHVPGNVGKNFFSSTIQKNFPNSDLENKVKAAAKGQSSIVEYTRSGVQKIASVQPIPILPNHNWVVIVTVPTNEVAALFLNPIINNAFNVALVVLAIAVFLIVLVLLTSSIRSLELQEAKDQFVSLTSHQLRTPLTAIRLFSEMLSDVKVGSLNETQKDYIDKIQSSTERMIRLVGNILNVSRVELKRIRVAPEPVKLNNFVSEHVDEIKPLISARKIELDVQLLPEEVTLSLDPILLGQVVHNLLTNAVRYTNQEHGTIRLKLTKTAEAYQIAVADNGIGIPAKAKKKIFSQFYRADNAKRVEGEGTGLGLYLVKAIAELTGCKVWFESTEGKGATFYVTIPASGMKPSNGDSTVS